MKLKGFLKFLCILSLTLLPISFSSAYSMVGDNMLEATPPDTVVVGNNVYVFNNNGNISTDSYGQFVYWHSTCAGYSCDYVYGWDNGKLYFAGLFGGNIQTQGYVQSLCPTVSGSNCTDFDSYSISNLIGSNHNITKILIGLPDSSSLTNSSSSAYPFRLCFFDSNNSTYYCVQNNVFNSGYPVGSISNLSGSLNFTSLDGIKDYSWTSSPFSSSNKPIEYYFSTGSCPTVGEFKSSSNLTPAVCYAGYSGDLIYTAGENTTIEAGSGLTFFETYELFSGNMTIQNWYDTYWTYYNNISFNPYPFYNKPKALLGLMVARQSAGLTRGYNGSYIILNYCYYILNNISDNLETCIGPNVSNQYPGIIKTDQDKKDIIDMVNDNYTVHIPGSGSIFLDPSQGLGGGGSSWGNEQCDGIPCLFEKFYQMFTSSRINDVDFSQGGEGILPGYIALAFVIVVLFYVFKR